MSTHRGKETRFRGLRSRLAAVAVVAVAVAGCAPNLEIAPPPSPVAQWIQLSHKVAFAPGRGTLSAAAARAIDGFVHRSEIAYGDRVVVRGGFGMASDAARALAEQRANVVVAYLRRHRIPSVRSPAAQVKLGPNQAAIVVGRYIAVGPDCATWSDALAGGDLSNERDRFGFWLGAGTGSGSGQSGRIAETPLGCATASALAAQIADPGDLVDGGSLGPGDAQFFTLGMRRYRADKAKKTTSIKTSGGGSK